MAEADATSRLRLIVSTKDMAEMFDVSGVSTISNWRARYANFPSPVIGGHNAQFDVDEVLAWARRPDTPARLTTAPPAEWWWAKTIDALRAAVEVPPGRTSREPLQGYLAALVLLRAALAGEIDGIGGGRRRWAALHSAANPAGELAMAAERLESSNPVLSGLFAEPLRFVRVPVAELRALLVRLDDATQVDVSSRRQFEIVLEHTHTAAHPRLTSSSTDEELAELLARTAHPAPGESVYDPCAGEGQLLVACARAAACPLTLFAQELDVDASRIARTRFLLEPLVVEVGRPGLSSIGEDQFPMLRADIVVADPPVSTKLPLVDWVDHAMGHLSDTGRCVITIPAHAVTLVEEARRRPEQGLRQRLTDLAGQGRVTAVTVLPANTRRDVSGPLTVWELGSRLEPGGSTNLRRLWPDNFGMLTMRSPVPTATGELLTAIGTAIADRDRSPGRGRHRPGPPPDDGRVRATERDEHRSGTDLRRALDQLSADLVPFLDQLTSEHPDVVHRIRSRLLALEERVTGRS